MPVKISPATRYLGAAAVDNLGLLLSKCIDQQGHDGPHSNAVREARRILVEAGF